MTTGLENVSFHANPEESQCQRMFKLLHNYTYLAAAAAAKLRQSCPTLCDPIDGSPTGSPIPGILQVRTLEWVAISFSAGELKYRQLEKRREDEPVQRRAKYF